MKTQTEVTIPAQIIRSNHMVSFGLGEENFAGQTFRGAAKGVEQVGDAITVRRQIDADKDETSSARVVARESYVTGDVKLTVELA